MTKERLQIIIEALNLSRDEMKQLQNDLEGTGDKANKSRESVSGVESSLGSLAKKIAVGVGVTRLASKFKDFTQESITLAARVETLGVVTAQLGKNVGMTESEIRNLERAIQDQGITTRKSREAVAQMIQAQIDLGEATNIARLAQNAAVIAGTNSSEAFDRLVAIIARGNTLMARNLGLIVDFEGAYENLASDLGKTTDELTKQERIQARTNEVMKAGENITGSYTAAMETAGKQMGSYARHFEELQVSFGKLFQGEFKKVIPFVTNVTDRLNAWATAGSAVNEVQKEINLQLEEGEISVEQWRERVVRAKAAESAWGKAKLLLGLRIREYNDLTDEQIQKIFGLNKSIVELIGKSTEAAQVLDLERGKQYELNEERERGIGLNNDYSESLPKAERMANLFGVERVAGPFEGAVGAAGRLAARAKAREMGIMGGGGGGGGSPAQITVEPGDTLSELAADLGTSVRALMEANPEIDNPSLIHAGQVLKTGFLEAADAVSGSPDSIDTKLNNLTSQPHTIDVRVNIMDPEQQTPFTQMIKEEIRESMR